MSSDIYQRVEKIFQGILSEKQLQTFHPNATMDEVEGWDSMSFLEVIMGLEGEFNLRIDGLDAADLISVPNIIAYLQAKS